MPDDALRRFLGGASRELFERSFGLDGARLRAGGQELLRCGGEAGESLLASTGLLNLRASLARLEEEAKTLVGAGRGRRRLSEATEAWREAQRASEERKQLIQTWEPGHHPTLYSPDGGQDSEASKLHPSQFMGVVLPRSRRRSADRAASAMARCPRARIAWPIPDVRRGWRGSDAGPRWTS